MYFVRQVQIKMLNLKLRTFYFQSCLGGHGCILFLEAEVVCVDVYVESEQKRGKKMVLPYSRTPELKLDQIRSDQILSALPTSLQNLNNHFVDGKAMPHLIPKYAPSPVCTQNDCKIILIMPMFLSAKTEFMNGISISIQNREQVTTTLQTMIWILLRHVCLLRDNHKAPR